MEKPMMDQQMLASKNSVELPPAFIYEFDVMPTDCDVFGHAGYSNYVRWQSLTVDALILNNPDLKNFLETKVKIKTNYAGMHYKFGAIPGDHVTARLNTSEIGSTSCNFLFTFLLRKNGILVGLGKQKVAFVDRESGEPFPISNSIAGILKRMQIDEKNLPYRYE